MQFLDGGLFQPLVKFYFFGFYEENFLEATRPAEARERSALANFHSLVSGERWAILR